MARTARPDRALTKAVLRAAARLKLADPVLALVLAIGTSSVARMKSGRYVLRCYRPEWGHGLTLVWLYQMLAALIGSRAAARAWLVSRNRAFEDARPVDMLVDPEGLRRVAHYLEAML